MGFLVRSAVSPLAPLRLTHSTPTKVERNDKATLKAEKERRKQQLALKKKEEKAVKASKAAKVALSSTKVVAPMIYDDWGVPNPVPLGKRKNQLPFAADIKEVFGLDEKAFEQAITKPIMRPVEADASDYTRPPPAININPAYWKPRSKYLARRRSSSDTTDTASSGGNEATEDISWLKTITSPRKGSVDTRRRPSVDSTKQRQWEMERKMIGGRRFLNVYDIDYMLPVDDEEIQRTNTEHYLIKWLLVENYRAPITELLDDGIKVLDVGCGTGVWLMDMATEFPDSQFHGVDVSGLYPDLIRPPNCHFCSHDVSRSSLPYPDDLFDFVYMRNMAWALSEDSWTDVIREIVRVTKPGGYIELVEMDIELKRRGEATAEWNNQLIDAMRARKLVPRVCLNLQEMLHDALIQNADMADVSKKFFSVPYGDWGSRIGKLAEENFYDLAKSLRPSLISDVESVEEYDEMVRHAMAEFDDFGTFGNYYTVSGRKPEKCPSGPRSPIIGSTVQPRTVASPRISSKSPKSPKIPRTPVLN